MIGYLIEQELMNALPAGVDCATLLTRVEVDAQDPAFSEPTKPIGPVYGAGEAKQLHAVRRWSMVDEAGGGSRRVVASPLPKAILGIRAIRLLVEAGVCVICTGGGGIPMIRNEAGKMVWVDPVIDKDRTSVLLAQSLEADALLLLTDVPAVFRDWGRPEQTAIGVTSPEALEAMDFDAGSMGPKVSDCAWLAPDANNFAGTGRFVHT